MEKFDFSLYILSYNFVIGVLLMVSSEKLGHSVGRFFRSYAVRVSRSVRVGVLTFGACAAVLNGGIYVAPYILPS
jgi:hypothetical protein